MIVAKTSSGSFVVSLKRDRQALTTNFVVVRLFDLDHLDADGFEDPIEAENHAVMIARILDRTVMDIDQTHELYNLPWEDAKRVFRRRYMDKAVAQDNNYVKTARRLGINRRTLYRWLERRDN
jgi:DNA-binding NtrC family response regulator